MPANNAFERSGFAYMWARARRSRDIAPVARLNAQEPVAQRGR